LTPNSFLLEFPIYSSSVLLLLIGSPFLSAGIEQTQLLLS
jgi:hypothetical protein